MEQETIRKGKMKLRKNLYEEALLEHEEYIYFAKQKNDLAPEKHFHERFEIVYVLEGSAELVCDDVVYPVQANDVVVINPYQFHYYSNVTPTFVNYAIALTDYYRKDFNMKYKAQRFHNLLGDRLYNESVLKKIFDEWWNTGRGNILLDVGYFNLIQGRCIEHYPLKGEERNVIEKQIYEVIVSFINEHYKEKLTKEMVAEAIGYSSSYFSTMFNQIMGKNFKTYVNEVRMREAAKLMAFTQKSNEEICEEVGFDSLSTFYRVKKKSGL